MEHFNQSCFCVTLDRDALDAALEREAADPEYFIGARSRRRGGGGQQREASDVVELRSIS